MTADGHDPTAQLASRLCALVAEELANALRLPRRGPHLAVLKSLAGPPICKFAALAAQFDADFATQGAAGASQAFLKRFTETLCIDGVGRVPTQGPLLVASNHPGGADILALTAALGRCDTRMVVSSAPLIEALPHAADPDAGCFIFVSRDPDERTSALRQIIRHLRLGRAVVLFPSTLLTPDPANCRDRLPIDETFRRWSPSMALALSRVPACRLQLAIVSGVLAPRFANHRLAAMLPTPPDKSWQRQRLRQMLQILHQLRHDDTLGVTPRITFGQADAGPAYGNLEDRDAWRAVLAKVVEAGERLLCQHAAGACPGAP